MSQWIVYDNEEREAFITSNYEKALNLYKKYKKDCEDYVNDSGEFLTDEGFVLAKIEKSFYSDFLYIENEGENKGEEVWEFKEEVNEDIKKIMHYITNDIYINKDKSNIDISEYCKTLEKIYNMLEELNN